MASAAYTRRGCSGLVSGAGSKVALSLCRGLQGFGSAGPLGGQRPLGFM